MNPKVTSITIYLCAGLAVACSFWGELWEGRQGLPPFTFRSALLLTPTVFLGIAYFRWIRSPDIGGRPKLFAALINSAAAGLLAYLVGRLDAAAIDKYSFTFNLLLVFLVPASLILSLYAVLSKTKPSYAVGMTTTLITWAYLACAIVLPTTRFLYVLIFVGAVFSPLVFAGAAIALFHRPGLGYLTGLVAGLMAAPSYLLQELHPYFENSWILLNYNPTGRQGLEVVLFAKLRMIAILLIAIAIIVSLLRMIPAHWVLRRRPICGRSWPAFALCAIMLPVWMGSAAMPYRIAIIADGPAPELAILHVVKRGLQFHESALAVYLNGFYATQISRRLLRYQFEESLAHGSLPDALRQRAFSLPQSLQAMALSTRPPKPLRAWNAEGWYVRSPGFGVLAFTTEYGTAPPHEVIELFHELEAAMPPAGEWRKLAMRDVCLGFCYDPLAGLGLIYSNDRCHSDKDGKVVCR